MNKRYLFFVVLVIIILFICIFNAFPPKRIEIPQQIPTYTHEPPVPKHVLGCFDEDNNELPMSECSKG